MATLGRRLLWISLGLVLAVVLAGCRDEAKPTVVGPTRAQPGRVLTVAAAADLKFALDDVVARFQRAHPEVAVKVVYGSSGSLFAQLSNRGPFDLFLSADVDYPRRLAAQGLAEAETEFPYAVGRIVVWVPAGSSLDPERTGIETVVEPAARKVAIANPKHAPYGRAAEAALKSLGVYDRVQDRLVLGENIAQTAHFIETGAADVGIIGLSLARSPAMRDKGRYWLVPVDAHPRMVQAGIIVSWTREKAAALELSRFLTGAEGRAVLQEHGFELPAPAAGGD
jgi:molybdate transport system substrate-binding protein